MARRPAHVPPLVDYGRGMSFPGSWYSGEPYEPEGWEQAADEWAGPGRMTDTENLLVPRDDDRKAA